MKSFIRKFTAFYEKMEDYLSGGLIFLGLTLVMVNILLRYVIGRPESILDEYSVYLVVWGAMLGFAVALRDDHHIKVDMLYRLLPTGVKRVVSLFAEIVGLAFSAAMAVYGTKLVLTYKLLGQGSADSQTPLWIVSLILPISGVMLVIRYLERVYDLFKNGGRDWLEKQVKEGQAHGNDSIDKYHSAI